MLTQVFVLGPVHTTKMKTEKLCCVLALRPHDYDVTPHTFENKRQSGKRKSYIAMCTDET